MPAVDQSRGLGTSASQPCGVQPPSPLTSHGSPEGLGFQQPDRASFSRPTTRPQDPGAELRPRRSASPAVPCACDAAPQGGRGVPALLHPVRSLGETRGDIVGLAAPASPSQDPIAPQDTGGHRLGLACDRSILRGLAGFPVGGGGGRPNTGSGRGGEEGRGKGPKGKQKSHGKTLLGGAGWPLSRSRYPDPLGRAAAIRGRAPTDPPPQTSWQGKPVPGAAWPAPEAGRAHRYLTGGHNVSGLKRPRENISAGP